jgi:hypothetical protein
MASGFVQRFKGKIALAKGGLWIGGTQFTGTGADLNSLSGFATPVNFSATVANNSTLPGSGLVLARSTGSTSFTYFMPAPTAGAELCVNLFVTSTAAFIKSGVTGTNTSPTFVLGGGSTFMVLTSTYSVTVDFYGLSTTQWLVVSALSTSTGAYPLAPVPSTST